jgi:hypothetical protein
MNLVIGEEYILNHNGLYRCELLDVRGEKATVVTHDTKTPIRLDVPLDSLVCAVAEIEND